MKDIFLSPKRQQLALGWRFRLSASASNHLVVSPLAQKSQKDVSIARAAPNM